MMANKILALLAAFTLGAALAYAVMLKMMTFALKHSSSLRAYLRDALDRRDADARFRLPGPDDALYQEVAESQMQQLLDERRCMCPIKYTGTNGVPGYGRCPAPATHEHQISAPDGGTHKIRMCGAHYHDAVPSAPIYGLKCAFGRSIPWTELCEREATLRYRDRFGIHDVCEEHIRTLEESDRTRGDA